jgi:integrase
MSSFYFYLTMRLGLRRGEVYALAKSRIRESPPQLIIDRAVQRGAKDRPARLGTRKNNKTLTLSLTPDVADAIRWHVEQGYSGPEFLFVPGDSFPKRLDSHKRAVQRALGLRELEGMTARGGLTRHRMTAYLMVRPARFGAGFGARVTTSCQPQVNGDRRRRNLVSQPVEILGRGDWIRTSDLMLPNHKRWVLGDR